MNELHITSKCPVFQRIWLINKVTAHLKSEGIDFHPFLPDGKKRNYGKNDELWLIVHENVHSFSRRPYFLMIFGSVQTQSFNVIPAISCILSVDDFAVISKQQNEALIEIYADRSKK